MKIILGVKNIVSNIDLWAHFFGQKSFSILKSRFFAFFVRITLYITLYFKLGGKINLYGETEKNGPEMISRTPQIPGREVLADNDS